MRLTSRSSERPMSRAVLHHWLSVGVAQLYVGPLHEFRPAIRSRQVFRTSDRARISPVCRVDPNHESVLSAAGPEHPCSCARASPVWPGAVCGYIANRKRSLFADEFFTGCSSEVTLKPEAVQQVARANAC